jgi:hypothetical protein
MSDKSKFVEMVNEYFQAGIINENDKKEIVLIYSNSNEGIRDAMDKYPEKVLDQYTPSARNLKSLKNNIQFMAWILIINVVCITLYYWYTALYP